MNPYSEQWRNGDGVKEDEEKIMGVGEEGGYSYNYYFYCYYCYYYLDR